jgi:hypothetical protein
MRSTHVALTTGALVLLVLTLTLSAQGKDVLEGTWKQNTAKSTCTAMAGATCAPAPQVATTRKYEDLGGGWLYVSNDGVGGNGMPNGNRIVARRDGKDYPIAARAQTAYVMIAFTVKSTRPYSADYVTKLDGKVTSNATETLSADGKTLTITIKNLNPQTGQPATNVVQVWDRQ